MSDTNLTKVCCISDLHNRTLDSLPKYDILVYAGDITSRGNPEEVMAFANRSLEWYEPKILVAGNHDNCLANSNAAFCVSILEEAGWIYLENDYCYINELKIYGSPYTKLFANWAFEYASYTEMEANWDLIPTDTDILITHQPPKGILDYVHDKGSIGCVALTEALKRVKPKLHVFGHFHESYGMEVQGETIYVNASLYDHNKKNLNEPIMVEI